MLSLRTFAFLALAGVAAVGSLPTAEARKTFLPGLKSYTFSMSPRKLALYCEERWRGRFWHVGKRYGCDSIELGERLHIRIDCQLNRPCIQFIKTVSADGGDGGISGQGGHSARGGQNNKP